MPGLIINGTNFTSASTNQQVFNALVTAPAIQAELNDKPLTASNTVLILQTEYARLNPQSRVEYIGTKFMYSCVFLHLYTSERSVSFHVDHTPIDLLNVLQDAGFKASDHIRCVLMGGYTVDKSIVSLGLIIEALKSAASTMTMEVVGQKIFAQNVPADSDLKRHCFILLQDNASQVFEQIYKKKFNADKVAGHRVSDLSQKIKPPKSMLPEEIYAAKINVLATLFNYVQDLYITSDYVKLAPYFSRDFIDTLFQTEDEFYKAVNHMYSANGFEALRKNFTPGQSRFNQTVCNFVINVKNPTRSILIISPNTPTPQEEERNLIPADLSISEYILCYDGDEYQRVSLSDAVCQFSKIAAQFTHGRIHDLVGLSQHVETNKLHHLKQYLRYEIIERMFQLNKLDPVSKTYKTIKEYLREDYQPSALMYLNAFSGYSFQAYLKRDAEALRWDAVLPCRNPTEAGEIVGMLQKHQLPASIVSFSGGPHVVVRDMNEPAAIDAVMRLKQ